ncbi:outer membrane protein assembly factor BamD [bacterium]|nr:outer membrane protein assembly factor BamD [bacterium]
MLKKLSFLIFILLSFLTACGGKTYRPPVGATVDQELRRCTELSRQKKFEKAVECLEIFKSRHAGSDLSGTAELYIADNFFRQKEYLLAANSYQDFIKNNPYHEKVDYAYYQTARSYLKDMPKSISRDQENLNLAVENLEILVRSFSGSPMAAQAQAEYNRARALQAKKHFYVGRFYYKYGEYLSAAQRFQEIVVNYPGLGYDEKGFYYLTEALLKTNQKDIAAKVIGAFEERYPRSELLKKVKSKVQKS